MGILALTPHEVLMVTHQTFLEGRVYHNVGQRSLGWVLSRSAHKHRGPGQWHWAEPRYESAE